VLQRFAQASLAEGHWLGGAADNAAVGINLLSFDDHLQAGSVPGF
jgi:hypothetical protein